MAILVESDDNFNTLRWCIFISFFAIFYFPSTHTTLQDPKLLAYSEWFSVVYNIGDSQYNMVHV